MLRTRRSAPEQDIDPVYVPIVRLYILRAIALAGGKTRFFCGNGFSDDGIARLIGFSEDEIDNFDDKAARTRLKSLLAAAQKGCRGFPVKSPIGANVAMLARELGLSGTEQAVLQFVMLERSIAELADTAELLGTLSLDRLCRALARIVDAPGPEVRAALDPRGQLHQMGLLSVDRRQSYAFRHKVDIDDTLPDEMSVSHDSLLALFAQHFVPAPASTLTMDDYAHVASDLALLREYLLNAKATRRTGVNVLIYGQPGTGKTELVRALATSVGVTLFEVAVANVDGEPKEGKARFNAYRLAQTLLSKSEGKAILFDEVEDVFAERKDVRLMDSNNSNSSGLKGWVNRMLESNPVPTFWITNRIAALDVAYRRRFDFSLRMDVPPRSARRRVLDACIGALPVGDAWRDEAANHEALAPALVDRAAKVVARVRETADGVDAEEALTRVMNGTLKSMGERTLAAKTGVPETEYCLDLLNVDFNLSALCDGLRRSGAGRICLYGPPGTGKTAFGRHVAEVVHRPLLVKHASDLLSAYLGETEKNIAAMFEAARGDGAVLLLDEADSMLRDREGAQRSWEVTQVNEMLTQMEAFEGIFIASTNLMRSLDPAAMRRFDARIRFDFLKPAQAQQMLRQLCARLSIDCAETDVARVARLDRLTPGDFASLARQCRLSRPASAADLLTTLSAVNDGKRDAGARPIGFAA